MKWKIPPIIKIYEALGVLTDDRIEIDGNTAKIYSSSRQKFYTVTFDPDKKEIMTNDNGSYWKGYLGYPAIAFLLATNKLPLRNDLAPLLKNIHWKDLNQKNNNDFDKTITEIFSQFQEQEVHSLSLYAEQLLNDIKTMDLGYSGKRAMPPKGY